jgi:hypothetical protein
VLQPVVTAPHINPNILLSTYWYSAAHFNLYISGKAERSELLLFLREGNFDKLDASGRQSYSGTMHICPLRNCYTKLTDYRKPLVK